MTCLMSPFHSWQTFTSPAARRSWPLSSAKTLMFFFCLISSSSTFLSSSGLVEFQEKPRYLRPAPSTFGWSPSSAMAPAYSSESSSTFQLSGVPFTADLR